MLATQQVIDEFQQRRLTESQGEKSTLHEYPWAAGPSETPSLTGGAVPSHVTRAATLEIRPRRPGCRKSLQIVS